MIAPLVALARTAAAFVRRHGVFTAALSLVLLAAGLYTWRSLRTADEIAAAPAELPAESERPLLVRAADRPTKEIRVAEGCVTPSCHATFTAAPRRHAAVASGACDACHVQDQGGHTYPLRADDETLCTTCHAISADHAFRHPARAVASGEGDRPASQVACLACHEPHLAAHRGLLNTPSLDATCAQCHPRVTSPVQHPPYAAQQCDTCHAPHGGDSARLLVGGDGANHCRQCHSDVVARVETLAHSHCDIDGGCLACHEAHAGNERHLLSAPPRDLCITCHPTVGKAIGSLVSHDAVLTGEQCVTCHDPHASSLPKMLRANQIDICLNCHAKPVTAHDGRAIAAMADSLRTSPIVHGAIRHGDCSACHTIHGGEHAKLLRSLPSEAVFGAGEQSTFGLCFACHDPTLVQANGSTSFRDGPRNLHEVHLRGQAKDRGCGSCHAAHAGSLPRLIATTVNYQGSGWAMPMRFELTPDGGSCAPGCHEKLAYRRSGEQPPNEPRSAP